MRQRAQQLADNMTQAGITPDNEKTHKAYNDHHDTLSYSHDNGTPLSNDPYGPCTLCRHNNTWVMFDTWGASYIPITWTGTAWQPGEKQTC